MDGVALLRAELAMLDEAILSRALVRELLAYGFGAQDAQTIERITSAVRSGEEATVNLTDGAHAFVCGRYVCMSRAVADVPETPLALQGETATPYGVFYTRDALEGETGDGVTSQVFDENVLFGCFVTGRREGDTLVPFGRHTGVKLKKLMIDAGVERPIRNSLPVLRKGESILWAVGLRPSELCRTQGGRRLMVIYRSKQ